MKNGLSSFVVAAVMLWGTAVQAGAENAWVRFSEDVSSIVVEADGISSFKGVSSAVYAKDGKNHRVGTRGYAVIEPVRETVGSDLHLSIGATEIDHLHVSPTRVEIKLSDAGAQEGSLTFYSKKALAAAGSENGTVTSVENLGDNLWKVSITGRQWGTAQQIALGIGK